MRITLKALGCFVALALVAQVAVAHGGNYQGPQGGGTPGYVGPVGGGTLGPTPGQPTPGQPGGTTPGPQPGGVTGPTGGGPPAPVRPGGVPVARGTVGRGGTTPGRKKSKNATPFQSWDWWWDLNEERFLLLKKKIRGEASSSDNKDLFLGEVIGGSDDVAKVTLNQIRKEILPALKLALKDPYYDARAGGVIALGKIGDKSQAELVDDIRSLMGDKDKRVRESSCLALGILGNADAIPDLLELVKNTRKGKKICNRGTSDVLNRTRAFAAIAIGLIGHRDGLDSKVIETLLGLAKTKTKQKDVQLGPVLALQLVKTQEGIPEMLELFNDEQQDAYIRAHIGVAFGKVGAKQATGALLKGLSHKSTHIARSCAISLGLLTNKNEKQVVTKLIRSAKGSPDRGVKNFSLIALGEIGDAKGIAHLVQMVKKGQTHDRTFAALALGINGFKTKSSANADQIFSQYKKVKNANEKSALAIALGLLNFEDAKETFRNDLERTGDQGLKGHLSTALGLMNDSDAMPIIRNLVKQKGDPDLRKRAAIALGLLKDASAVETLERVIQESSASKAILGAATVALGFVGDRQAVPILVKMVENAKNSYQDVTRAFATVALGFLGDKDDIPILSRVQESSNYLAQTEALAEVLTIL